MFDSSSLNELKIFKLVESFAKEFIVDEVLGARNAKTGMYT